MFIVTTRNKFLAAHEIGAVTVTKYRHVRQGEPALNQNLHMTKAEADDFLLMQLFDKKETQDITASKITTYTITED